MFHSILQTFGTKTIEKLLFWGRMHYFRISNFWKMFCHEHIQSNVLDPKLCLLEFRSISQTFDTKNHEKLVLQGWMHYFRVPKFLKMFCHERIQSTPLDPKCSLRVFRSISQTSSMKNDEKLVFRAWMQYFGVSKLRKKFVRNACNLLALDPKWCSEVFQSISQIFTMKNDGNFVLGMNALFHSTELPKKFH